MPAAAGRGCCTSGRAVSAEIVQNHRNHRSLGRVLIYERPHLLGKVLVCPVPGHLHMPPVGPRLKAQEQVGRTLPAVLVVHPRGAASRHRLGRPCVGQELKRQLVKAPHRPIDRIGLGREVEPTRGYVRKRMAEGKGKMEIIRCLKRIVAREIFGYLCRATRPPTTVSSTS
jgi:hypothetical protein